MTVKWGIIGVGGIGSAYVQSIRNSPHAELTALAETDATRRAEVADAEGCRGYATAEEMRAAGGIDAVLICTPPASHGEIATPFLEAGVPVLCEKPFTITNEEAEELVATARRHGTLLGMASKFRFVDGVLAAHELVAEGKLGDRLKFTNRFLGAVDMRNRWNSDATVSGGGVLIDNGTHSLDIARFLLGPIASLEVKVGEQKQGLDVEEAVDISFETHGGARGQIALSWNENGGDLPFLEIEGTKGSIAAGWKSAIHFDKESGEKRTCAGGYGKFVALQGQIDDFSAAIREGVPSRCQPEDAIEAVRMINAAYRSIREGGPVQIPAPSTQNS